ncbi:NfeD family protein [Dongshaea marina]|uniref:NfeD family protein n=1 Tax=Dongshaea marina TaxID=2047966 RepID=UPI000D3E5734|nr:NfeD family protein [Dongshaea marina]
MLILLAQINFWHWLAFGGLLLLGELLGAAGFLFWVGLAALEIGVIMLIYPIGWEIQWLLFAIQSLVTTLLWWRYQHSKDQKAQQETTLNLRAKSCVGQQALLLMDVEAGYSRIKLEGTTWRVRCPEALKEGDLVEVTEFEGTTLAVKGA